MFNFMRKVFGPSPKRSALHNALLAQANHGGTLLMGRDTSFRRYTREEWESEQDARLIEAIRSVPVHYAGIGSITGSSINAEFKWSAATVPTTSVQNPISNPGDIKKSYTLGTAAANNASGGCDEVFSFYQSISAGSTATLDLTAMTNVLGTASVSIARIKGILINCLSAVDDSTVAANSKGVLVGNHTSMVPADLFNNGGSGATVTLSVSGGAVTGVAVGVGGTGYPPSTSFLMVPQQSGASSCMFMATTNSSGVITSMTFITGFGGSGYTAATVPCIVAGQRYIAGGTASIQGGSLCYFDATAAGFMLVNSTGKNLLFTNCDGTNAATVGINIFAGSS